MHWVGHTMNEYRTIKSAAEKAASQLGMKLNYSRIRRLAIAGELPARILQTGRGCRRRASYFIKPADILNLFSAV